MNNVRRLRRRLGWSIAELSRRTGMNPTTIGQAEAGRFIPYPSQVGKLAEALGVKPDQLGIEQPEELQSAC